MADVRFKVTTNRANKRLLEMDINKQVYGVAEALAKDIAKRAQENFKNAEYDGVNDVEVECNPVQTGANKTRTYEVVAKGSSTLFIEYGTGVTLGRMVSFKRPPGIASVGHYGRGQGSHKGWVYKVDPGNQYTSEGGPYVHTETVLEKGERKKIGVQFTHMVNGKMVTELVWNGKWKVIKEPRYVEKKIVDESRGFTRGNIPNLCMTTAEEQALRESPKIAKKVVQWW